MSRSTRDPAAVRDDLEKFQAQTSPTSGTRPHIGESQPGAADPNGEPVEPAPFRPSGAPGIEGGDRGGALPTRRPGVSYAEPEMAERSVEASHRDPAELKSAFSAYQLGMTVGRGSREEEQHE